MATKHFSTGLRNKSNGININKFVNGSFTSDTTGITAVDAVLSSVAGGQSGNCLQIAESGGINPGKGYQDVTTKVGNLYMLELYFKKGTAANGKFMVGTTVSEASIYNSGNLSDVAWAKKQIWFLATATTTRITFQSNDVVAGTTSLFDEVRFVSMARSLQDVFYKGFIDFYTGTIPASADDAPSGTKLLTLYSDGASVGLTFDDSVAGVLSKAAAETWSGSGLTTGTIGWCRLRTPGDSGTSSTTDERIDMDVSTSGAAFNISSLAVQSAVPMTISGFTITLNAS